MALYEAARDGKTDVVSQLLNGVDVNCQDPEVRESVPTFWRRRASPGAAARALSRRRFASSRNFAAQDAAP